MNKLIFVASALLLAVGFGARYQNSTTLRSLVEVVIAMDSSGKDTASPLKSARDYAAGHMSAPIRIILQASYERAVEKAKAAVTPPVNNAEVYAQAQRVCGTKTDSVTQARCNQNYIASRLAPAETPSPAELPKISDYTYDLKPPLWTSDVAGVSFVLSAVLLFAGLAKTLVRRKL